ncbi:SCO2400 family protein [Streptomyces sp. NPDC000229]|uniref:SCO2400 family protein n=1 Tax=Streptomyces sp. NPDC000229 TaxID=3154247 RepID=UPI003334321C
MDYCDQCQRHLNGALACAGCGTPVEELRHDPQTSAAEHVYELDRDDVHPPAESRRARGQARRAQPASRRSRPVGRRARKRRGRKLLIGLVALILAAGLLSLAELAIEHPGEDGAATAVRQDDVAVPQPPPEQPEGSEAPDGPSPVNEPVSTSSAPGDPEDGSAAATPESGAPTGAPGASASAPGAGPGGTPSAPRPSDAPEEPGSPEAPGQEDPAPEDPPPGDPGEPGNPDDPEDPAPDEPAPDDPPPAEPTPEPTPTESCDWFLWWCV